MKYMYRLAWVASVMVAGAAVDARRQGDVRSSVIDAQQLLQDLKTLSAEDMQGRQVDTEGGARARAFVIERFKASGIAPIGASYEQPFTFAGRGAGAAERHGVNVVGQIEGTRNPKRYIVISAHYDHIGVRNGQVFNGADDNASGTAALFALARYFSTHKPANTLIFAAFDAEESGLRGSRAFVAAPPVDAASIVIDLNMDMIGRDPKDLLFVVGTYTQPFLKPLIERIAAKAPVKLTMGHDDPVKARENRGNDAFEDWTAQSDHKSFCDAKIPCLYFGVEDFDQHHAATDDYETMTYAFFVKAVETMVLAAQEFDAHADDVMKARLK
ncbi:MAG TPA: M28 family peptidase [Vicinamibacterales bacterium]|nr:M28 family peptidase [Vicinamibacterales bacterium]